MARRSGDDRPLPDLSKYGRLAEYRASGMGEGIASDGGFLLQQDFSTELLKSRNAVGKVAGFCKKITVTTGNSIALPVIDETNRTTGNRWGGVRSYWGSEAALLNASAPKIGKLTLEPKKHYVMVYASDELLEDVSVLSQFINDAAAEELGLEGPGLGVPDADPLGCVGGLGHPERAVPALGGPSGGFESSGRAQSGERREGESGRRRSTVDMGRVGGHRSDASGPASPPSGE